MFCFLFLTLLWTALAFFINPCHLFISLLVFHSFSVYPRDYNTDPWLVKVYSKLVLLPLVGKCRNFRPLKTPFTPFWLACYCHLVPSGILILYVSQTPQEDFIIVLYRQYLFRLTTYFLSPLAFVSFCIAKCPSGIHVLLPKKPYFTNSFDGGELVMHYYKFYLSQISLFHLHFQRIFLAGYVILGWQEKREK